MRWLPAAEAIYIVGAALIALGTICFQVWTRFLTPLWRWVRDVHTVVTRELSDDSGKSMKDRLSATQLSVQRLGAEQKHTNEKVELLQRHLEMQQRTLERHVENSTLDRSDLREWLRAMDPDRDADRRGHTSPEGPLGSGGG
jgi:hypothetical protein